MPASPEGSRDSGRRAVVLAALAIAVAGLASCGNASSEIPPKLGKAVIDAALATSPPGLSPAERALEADANTLLPGDGSDAGTQLDEAVASLRGTPVVVNLWGDWCEPCRKEIPIFQRVTLELRGKVAFLGVATRSTRPHTDAFLAEDYVLPYPSIFDPDEQINNRAGVASIPKTLFYKASGGKPFVHLGTYTSADDLRADIAAYAGGTA